MSRSVHVQFRLDIPIDRTGQDETERDGQRGSRKDGRADPSRLTEARTDTNNDRERERENGGKQKKDRHRERQKERERKKGIHSYISRHAERDKREKTEAQESRADEENLLKACWFLVIGLCPWPLVTGGRPLATDGAKL